MFLYLSLLNRILFYRHSSWHEWRFTQSVCMVSRREGQTTSKLQFNLEHRTNSMDRSGEITGNMLANLVFTLSCGKDWKLHIPLFSLSLCFTKKCYQQGRNQIICIHTHKVLLSWAERSVPIAHTDGVKTIQPPFYFTVIKMLIC